MSWMKSVARFSDDGIVWIMGYGTTMRINTKYFMAVIGSGDIVMGCDVLFIGPIENDNEILFQFRMCVSII